MLFTHHFAAYWAIIVSFFIVCLIPFLLFFLCLQFFDLHLANCMMHTASLFNWEVQITPTTVEAIAVNLIMLFFLFVCVAVFLGVFLFFEDLDKTDTIHPILIFAPPLNK